MRIKEISMPSFYLELIFMYHYSDVTWPTWRPKSPATQLFVQSFVLAYIKEKHQSSVPLTFVREIHRSPVDSPTKGQLREKLFHVITSPWQAPHIETWKHNESKHAHFLGPVV